MKSRNCFKSQGFFFSKHTEKTTQETQRQGVLSDGSQTQGIQAKGFKVRGLFHTDLHFCAHASAAAMHGWSGCSRAPFAPLAPLAVPRPSQHRPWQGAFGQLARPQSTRPGQPQQVLPKTLQFGPDAQGPHLLAPKAVAGCTQFLLSCFLDTSSLKVCQPCPGFPRMLLNHWLLLGY